MAVTKPLTRGPEVRTRELTGQDLDDILLGAALLGTGGGGEVAEGRALIDEALDAFDAVFRDLIRNGAIT